MGSFESSIARLNAAVGSRLANAAALLDSVPVRVLFDHGTREALGGISVQPPTAGLESRYAEHTTQDSLLHIIGIGDFRVLEVQPDGAGWTWLNLIEAAPQ